MIGFYRIADQIIRVESLFEDIHDYCREYEVKQQEPDFEIVIHPEDLDYERKKSEAEAAISPRAFQGGSDGMLETLAVYRKIAEKFPLLYNTFLFHGSSVAVDGSAYLFTAKSGTGKSTHVSLWRKYLGDRAVMVNDDKPLILVSEGETYIYGTPWCGKHRLGNDICVPLRAICILERGEKNEICRIGKKEILPMLLQQAYRPSDIKALEKTVQLLSKMSEQVVFFRLKCNMDPEAAEVSYGYMSKVIGEELK